MSRYIEVGHLKKSVEGLQDCYNGFSDTYDKACIIGLIDEEPTADVVPVRHGYWKGKPIAGHSTVRCSVCGDAFFENNGRWNYCPSCGAIMDEVES